MGILLLERGRLVATAFRLKDDCEKNTLDEFGEFMVATAFRLKDDCESSSLPSRTTGLSRNRLSAEG